ncbi:Dynein heavy chain 17, axonemal [Cichlidogyrus casuarinus]|uniref:Dynein heavy chain 17, axonemal n=1 Tax=Cichlidogyrus casuarinus TaxID=1844966 RepID=A0ABD2PZ76_9PLAT
MNNLLDGMQSTLHSLLADSLYNYNENETEPWILETPGQVVLLTNQITWCVQVMLAFSFRAAGNLEAFSKLFLTLQEQIDKHLILMQSQSTVSMRHKIRNLITIEIHNRDIVQALDENQITSHDDFMWLSQLRPRWDENSEECLYEMCNFSIAYAFEYFGNSSRCVFTPLRDECVLTLIQATQLNLGGMFLGPEGTGKTELIHDLSKTVGRNFCLVNCYPEFSNHGYAEFLKGLVQTGAWACFRYLDRIPDVSISVLATHIRVIQQGIQSNSESIMLMGSKIPLSLKPAIFATICAVEHGRMPAPENFKMLFRPTALIKPDYEKVFGVLFQVESFAQAQSLAKKLALIYKMCAETLSKQTHYDWNLGSMKQVLVKASELRKKESTLEEESILFRALEECLLQKLVSEDIPKFWNIIKDTLRAPMDTDMKRKDSQREARVKEAMVDCKYNPYDTFVEKAIQLDDLLMLRRSTFIVGEAACGKSAILKSVVRGKELRGEKAKMFILDPKVFSPDLIYGHYRSKNWINGLLPNILKYVSTKDYDHAILVLDGDVDGSWIESLEQAMVNAQDLLLPFNARIPIKKSLRFLIETTNLQNASPSIVSRANVLFVSASEMGWLPIVNSWIEHRGDRQSAIEKASLIFCFEKYMEPTLNNIQSFTHCTKKWKVKNFCQTLCYLYDALSQEMQLLSDKELDKDQYEQVFVYCFIWAFAGKLGPEKRQEFSQWWLQTFHPLDFLELDSIFDVYWCSRELSFKNWSDFNINIQDPVLRTRDVLQLKRVTDLLMSIEKPVLLMGQSGAGQINLINSKIEEYTKVDVCREILMDFNKNSQQLQRELLDKMEKKSGSYFSPPGEKKMIVFLHDLNAARVDEYGTAELHSLLRQLLDNNMVYDHANVEAKIILKTQYVATMNAGPSLGHVDINDRLKRHFCTLFFSPLGEESMKTILKSGIDNIFDVSKLGEDVRQYIERFVDIAVRIHGDFGRKFRPTVSKIHYTFNLDDLSNLIEGISFVDSPKEYNTLDSLSKLFKHELIRTYTDKLCTLDDRDHGVALINQKIISLSPHQIDEQEESKSSEIFSHAQSGKYASIDSTKEALKSWMADAELPSFYKDNLILFPEAANHVFRLVRHLRRSNKYVLMAGEGGTGKETIAVLASALMGYTIERLDKMDDSLEKEFSKLQKRCELNNEKVVLIIKGSMRENEKIWIFLNHLITHSKNATWIRQLRVSFQEKFSNSNL